jgi:aminopeptidase YwaD
MKARKYPSCKLMIFLIQVLILQCYFGAITYSQYPVNYQYTLLAPATIDEIIGASSGDLALHHIINLAPYPQPRQESEFPDNFRESNYILSKLKEYGIKKFSLDKVGTTNSWMGVKGTVWEVSPGISKIADFNDEPEMLVEGSKPTDLTGKLVWAGEGQASFFENNKSSITGKILVTSGSPYSVHARAMQAGALGIISYYSFRPLTDPLQMPNLSIPGDGFAFLLPPREGVLLRDRLLARENIEVKVEIESKVKPVDLLVPQCVVTGTDSTAGEIIFTAHLFEGYVKMGANDNMSGASVILEVAHLLNDLINEGKIERPVRNIRFLWVPEFTGTVPWVNRNLSLVRNAMCNINLDMVGVRLRDNRSFMCFNRSGYSTAHFINDIMENYYRYVGETNVEGITDDLTRRGFSRRIVSPTGSDDPFYYRILSLYGSSDNAVFNDWSINIPGVKMNDWPDNYYHSSEDTPDKCDPTQLRRAIFIAASAAYTAASAGDEGATRILSEVYAGANMRMGIQMEKSTDMILKSGKHSIAANYKRAVYNLEGFEMAEEAAMGKIRQLSSNSGILKLISDNQQRIRDILEMNLENLEELMKNRCRALNTGPVGLNMNEMEKAARKIVPAYTEKARTMGYGNANRIISSLPGDFLKKNPYSGIVNIDEAAGLANGTRNLLEIKKMIDAEFERESPLEDIMHFYSVLKEAGLMQY